MPAPRAIPSSSEALLTSLIALTEQRDRLSLETSLYQACEEIFQPTALASLEWLPGNDGHAVVHMSQRTGQLGEAVLAAARALATDIRLEADEAGDVYMLMRIEAMAENGQRVLVLGKAAWSDVEVRIAQGMLRVYQNFVRLLNDSEKDTLTGLLNRKRLEKTLEYVLASRNRGRRDDDRGGNDYLAVLDIDHFKSVNDTFGHLIGDEVLLAFANLMRRSLREGDGCYRYGGEEFIILLHDLRREQVITILERLRGHVANHVFPQAMHITVSIGFTQIGGQRFPAEIVEEADRALYYAKNHGRDQVREFETLSLAGEIEMPKASGSVEMF
jgi:diguanylate cyclase (GGDEF)-like protein